MAEGDRPIYCPQCKSIAQAGDRFCAVCGAMITPDAPVAGPTQEIPTLVQPPPGVVPARGRHRTLALFAGFGALVVVLLVFGAILAMNLFGGETAGQGRVQPKPTATAPTKQESTENASQQDGRSKTTRSEADLVQAVEGYYQAVDREDWDYTYDHLDAETKSRFTREEWFKKNQWFADNGEVIYRIESVERPGTSSGLVVGVSLRLTYEDGSSSTRSTYFVYEDGEWKHAFSQEEYDLFMPAVPYEEFVKAR